MQVAVACALGSSKTTGMSADVKLLNTRHVPIKGFVKLLNNVVCSAARFQNFIECQVLERPFCNTVVVKEQAWKNAMEPC